MQHIWSCYSIQLSQFLLEHWNRLLFSQLNTWHSSWLPFRGHVVPKKKSIFKHLNRTQPGEMLILWEQFRDRDQMKEHEIHNSLLPRLGGVCLRGTWHTVTHTVYVPLLLSLPGRVEICECVWELYSLCVEEMCYLKPLLFLEGEFMLKEIWGSLIVLACPNRKPLWWMQFTCIRLKRHRGGGRLCVWKKWVWRELICCTATLLSLGSADICG